jgi:phosphoribosylformylglycinamidine cyclo-ligase
MRYRDAGVDIGAGDAIKSRIGARVRATWGPAVVPVPGGFCGVMRWPAEGGAMLAATVDGVGTKLHVALAAGRVADATADLVRHCANDLLVHGATPLAFLDYMAQARLAPAVVEDAIEGMARACGEVGAALIGGETAQMPDTYLPDVIDVAGCMIGRVTPSRFRDGSAVRAGDRILGLASDGLHTNGYSLARRVLAESGLTLESALPGDERRTIADALLAPHRWYGRVLEPLLDDPALHALAHVTGGGVAGNLIRVLPSGCRAVIDVSAWRLPPVFAWIERAGGVPVEDMRSTFNLGVGMALVVAADAESRIASMMRDAGETVDAIGRIESGERGVEWNQAEERRG